MLKKQTATSSFNLLFFSLSLFLLTGCNHSGNDAPDVSGIKVNLKTYRFDLDFSSMDTSHIGQSLQKLHEKYPEFLNYYLDTFLAIGIHGNYSDTSRSVADSIRPYFTVKDFVGLEDTIKKYYPDSKETDAALTNGFKYMKYYFPRYTVPRVLYINMYLSNFTAFPWDSTTLCIGLDWFLGDQFPFYFARGVPSYNTAHVRKDYLPVSAFNAVYQFLYPSNNTDKTLLDLMLQRGKEQYFLHRILPHTPDSVLFGYPQHKLEWCDANENMIYNFFIHQSLLYNKDPTAIMPYVNDGPFAVNFPADRPAYNTPGNIGTWLGYRIVCAYMEQNKQCTLKQLLDQPLNAPQFLEQAKYRPK